MPHDNPDLIARLTAVAPFDGLDEQTRQALADELEAVHLTKGKLLCRQGERGNSMYVLLRGRLEVLVQDADGSRVSVGELGPGDLVGEMALLADQARTATVRALEEADLVQLSRAGFERIAARHPDFVAGFMAAVAERRRGVQLASVLARLCGEMDVAAFRELQARLRWRHLAAGETLFRRGDPGDALYIVIAGRLFFSEGEGATSPIRGEIGPGEVVGEFALLTGEPRSANVGAIRDTDLVEISRPVFEELTRRYPRLLIHLARNIIGHSRQALRVTRPADLRALAFAVAPTTPAVPLSAFTRRLVEELAAFGSTLHLSSERFDRAYGRIGMSQTTPDHPAHAAITAWLSEQETRYRYIVYETDASWTPWTGRCLRQADRLLLVGWAGDDPTPGEIEALLPRREGLRTELVLIHPEDAERPRGTAAWLASRQVQAHYHVRLGRAADLQHLARRLTGQGVGLVLSGGGARGMAHVGVIRALEEKGLSIDFVGGTSIGSVIGAVFALGWDYEEIVHGVQTFSSGRALLDRTLPLVSLYAGQKLSRVLRALFGGVQIEDLWRPYFCISCDVSQGREVVHRSGSLWRAVRASVAIPGVFPPLLDEEGNLLVDGGVINNFPIDVMRGLCGDGVVIAVDVSSPRYRQKAYRFGPGVSGWRVLGQRLNPFVPAPAVPSLLGSLMRVLGVNSLYRAEAVCPLADLIIRPPVRGIGLLEFDAYAEIIEVGYRAARQALAAWSPEVGARRPRVPTGPVTDPPGYEKNDR